MRRRRRRRRRQISVNDPQACGGRTFIAAPYGEIATFAKEQATAKVDDTTSTSLQSWALTSICEDDLAKMNFLEGATISENSLLFMPPHYLVWELVPEPCHGLRFSFLPQLPEDVSKQ
eukprot:9470460-Pyramimonas_sp.AAC.1